MIFVTVGTNEAPFDRLLDLVRAAGIDEELIVQSGSSSRMADDHCVPFMPFDALVDHVRAARHVIMHAGVGSVMVALANGKRPIVVPRRRRHGEAVDDHQIAFAQRLHGEGLVTIVDAPATLAAALTEPSVAGEAMAAPESTPLATELRAYAEVAIRGG